MKTRLLLTLLLATASVSLAQSVDMYLKYGLGSQLQDQLAEFENVKVQTLTFVGPSLRGTYYQVLVKEFKNGVLAKTETLFDGGEIDFFKINSDTVNFRLFVKADEKVKLQLLEPRFSSKKLLFDVSDTKLNFALKDFMGNKPRMEVKTGQKFYVFALITPTIHSDGSGSYCEVAQSGVDPEELGKKYNIPHYFLIEIVFK
ncbi:MAG: hypothetical protein H7Y12_05825 [Sphingobacteriaceae bacterium]|nr:hypothetical protein [Cytophagaceae bacterium]